MSADFLDMLPPPATFVLLWHVDKKGKPIEPAVTFTAKFPGDGFNHTVQLHADAGTEYLIPCPCGVRMRFLSQKPNGATEAQYRTEKCPTCQSWHSFKWLPPVIDPEPFHFINC